MENVIARQLFRAAIDGHLLPADNASVIAGVEIALAREREQRVHRVDRASRQDDVIDRTMKRANRQIQRAN